MKRNALTTLLFALTWALILAYSMPLNAGNDKEDLLSALERTFDMIPEDGFIINATDLQARIKSGKKDFVIIDTRPQFEDYEASHLPGAVYIPWREIVKEDSLKHIPRDKDVILYCSSGHLENQALIALRALGYKAYVLRWGMLSWAETRHTEQALEQINAGRKTGYPVERGVDEKNRKEHEKRKLAHEGC